MAAVISIDSVGDSQEAVNPSSPGTAKIRVGDSSTLEISVNGSAWGALSGGATGRSTILAGASSVVVTNALATSTSVIIATLQTVDATLTQILTAVPASGTFTINANANATADVVVAWSLS